MKKYARFLEKVAVGFVCVFFTCCITEYNPKGIDEIADILVVEGIVTDYETAVILSRSANLTGKGEEGYLYYVNNAKVYVECDDGTQWQADDSDLEAVNGQYMVRTGLLNMDKKYRLKIEIEEVDFGSDDCTTDPFGRVECPMKTYEYCSDYSYPIPTPEIDSVFWTKRGRGQSVNIHVATHSPESNVLYYRWSYKEDWEINSEYFWEIYPYYCWGEANHRDLVFVSAEKTVMGKLTEIITEISPSHKKLSVLYRITVKQNAISKRAYDYFSNIKKNVEQSGSIFAPIPSELRGNITCTNDPARPVIGYVDISTTTQRRLYISRAEVYERPYGECSSLSSSEVIELFGEIPPFIIRYDPYEMGDDVFVDIKCVDCSVYDVVPKPDDWPNDH